MAGKVKPIPDNYHSITPYLVVNGGARALEFYKKVFGATELFRMDGPEGKVTHAEIKIGDSIIMVADEVPKMGYRSPEAFGGTPVSMMLYVEDVDSVANKLSSAGAKTLKPVENQF